MMENTDDLGMIINPFSADSSKPFEAKAQKVEEAESQIDALICSLLESYEHFARNLQYPTDTDLDKNILTPPQIDTLLQIILLKYIPKTSESWTTGEFISELMNVSYRAGNNDFKLTTGNRRIELLPNSLNGRDVWDSIKYTLNGDANGCNELAKCIAIHKGNVSGMNAFQSCYNSIITVYGDIEAGAGFMSQDSDFRFYGKVADGAGEYCQRCTFTFFSDLGSVGKMQHACRYKAIDMGVFEKLCTTVRQGHDNIVELIEKDGTIVMERNI